MNIYLPSRPVLRNKRLPDVPDALNEIDRINGRGAVGNFIADSHGQLVGRKLSAGRRARRMRQQKRGEILRRRHHSVVRAALRHRYARSEVTARGRNNKIADD